MRESGAESASCSAPGPTSPRLVPGWRNEFHAGLQQAFGKYLVFSGEYIWKYTHNAYDFSVLGATPITFPIEWDRSKIPGYAGRVSVPNLHGFSALMVFSSVAARFFTPQIGGAGAVPSASGYPFRIDHDEKFNMTFHTQYQPWKTWPVGRLQLAIRQRIGGRPRAVRGRQLPQRPVGHRHSGEIRRDFSADQQFEAGLFCGSVRPAPPTPGNPTGTPLSSSLGTNLCPAAQYGSTLLQIPAPGTENDDHNPPRVAPRNLFDVAVGDDNLFKGEHYKWSLTLTAINITNKYARLQLPLDVQRHTLRDAARTDGSARLPLLADAPRR